MENNGIELHSKNHGTTQREMEGGRTMLCICRKKWVDTHLHHNTLRLFACTLYQQPRQHNLLSFLLSKMSYLDTFLPSGIYSFTFSWGYHENVLQRDKAAREDKNCRIHLYDVSETVQLAGTQSRVLTAQPGAGEGKWDSHCHSLDGKENETFPKTCFSDFSVII